MLIQQAERMTVNKRIRGLRGAIMPIKGVLMIFAVSVLLAIKFKDEIAEMIDEFFNKNEEK